MLIHPSISQTIIETDFCFCQPIYSSQDILNYSPWGGGGGGGISGMNLVQVCRWAFSYPPYKCILEYGKSIPINVYTIMEDNKKCSLFPFKLTCLMQKIISTVKCWIINWFLSESNKRTWRDKGQVVRLSTAGDWMEGYKCIFEMKSWPIDV